ncbi:hypothetical protein K493DRAFT_298096 [Basidiobolus meristosporus CBS 931.73]|uniref:Uncharacterized protein n=1 Tax=Basidiobolus meristosporus CBS 931.73 TaxID=1314790 RepID=A0A1Y1YWS8_9FUNG|nr:hypothetical protein K493DRAFT_298096 [Basidiobolus meristosporus CBS 931.73]|eukprot:ORY02005.1 hypothetical protein K493DRAFT_298096 [Basidiobolus meristosporus CBS 931.73]
MIPLKSWCWVLGIRIMMMLVNQDNIITSVHGQAPAKCRYIESYSVSNTCQDDTLTCNKNQQCVRKKCIYDPDDTGSQAPMCNDAYYCPYDRVECQKKIPLGGDCDAQKANFNSICVGDTSVICLNQVCTSRNVTLGGQCTIDSVLSVDNSVDNCMPNTFCSQDSRLCVSRFADGESCTSNAQCQSSSCKNSQCQASNEQELYHSLPVWVYIVIGVVAGVAVLLCALFIYFRRRRRMRNYKKMLNLSMSNLSQFGGNRDSNPNPSYPAQPYGAGSS